MVRGYGILQPRVGVSLPSAHRSPFAAVHSGHPGVDPYTTAVSDVYQDLYGEGSFTGKGIYDVDAFEHATHGRFPENTLLSHDLIEGNYARAGPGHRHRGLRRLPGALHLHVHPPQASLDPGRLAVASLAHATGCPARTATSPTGCPLLSRWKILDNLRRSTVELAQLAFLIAGWTILPARRFGGRCSGSSPSPRRRWSRWCCAMLRPPLDKSWRAYYAAVAHDAVTSAQQAALAITFLPHQAWVSADAILRTLWRLWVTRRQPAGVADRVPDRAARLPGARRGLAYDVAGGCLAARAARRGHGRGRTLRAVPRLDFPALTGAALPLLALWSASPLIAYAISAPAVRRERRLPGVEPDDALRYALLHWHYFDRFVTGAPTGSRPTISRKTPRRSWRCVPRPPTSACSCSRP